MNQSEKICIYARTAQKSPWAIELQITQCKDYIRTHYGEDTLNRITIYQDDGFADTHLNRSAYIRMFEDARHRDFNIVITHSISRLGRRITAYAALINELRQFEIQIISIKDQLKI